MSFQKINLIWHKEMKSLFRDKKALITIFLPILIYPIIMIFFMGFSMMVQSNLEGNMSAVAIEDTVNEGFVKILQEDERIEILPLSSIDFIEDINEGNIDAAITMTLDNNVESYEVHYNSTIDGSDRAFYRVRSSFRLYEEQAKEDRLMHVDIDERINDIVAIEMVEISDAGDTSDDRMIAMVLGMLVPFILLIYSIIGSYTISSDLSAGEKERETLETIFSVPIKRFEIITGKLLAGVTVGMISGFVNIASLFPLLYVILNAISDLNISLSFQLLVFLFIMLLPVMIMTSAFLIGLGLFAKTYQEAQSYGSVLLIAFMFPCYLGLIPDIELTSLTLFIPITNSLLVMKEAFLGDYHLFNIGIILLVNMSISAIAIIIMNKLFQSDWVIFRSEKG
ncbi:ABC-type Na+ efflux pump, permease component [Natronincola peptidivorans]|uniref:ABC-type Na+ efflux pump, permease component n=1 Tax=Natronincola peptidivorans TaxID=426128 RepID=A0A1I0GS48_9FIRM|nr:ABC transporter permease [Natronincola peptidivorans]SET74006.1 ABC-type Na+ efflux pump, permease component [Natronincola peptidivorans]